MRADGLHLLDSALRRRPDVLYHSQDRIHPAAVAQPEDRAGARSRVHTDQDRASNVPGLLVLPRKSDAARDFRPVSQ